MIDVMKIEYSTDISRQLLGLVTVQFIEKYSSMVRYTCRPTSTGINISLIRYNMSSTMEQNS